jgi:DNA polymerase III epsilon subunit-like protein
MKALIIDTETTGTIDDPICYDIGFAVIDENGTTYEKGSFVVADVFLDDELMSDAYFKEKIPQYWEDIKNGSRQLRKFSSINFIIRKIMTEQNITTVIAHNARFDYRSTNLTKRYITSSKYRYFFPYGTEIWDTLKMSKEILKDDEQYRKFCIENGFVTSRNQNRYTAEIIYRFLTNDLQFIESHTALEDVMIEKEIFAYCVQKNPNIDGRLWA